MLYLKKINIGLPKVFKKQINMPVLLLFQIFKMLFVVILKWVNDSFDLILNIFLLSLLKLLLLSTLLRQYKSYATPLSATALIFGTQFCNFEAFTLPKIDLLTKNILFVILCVIRFNALIPTCVQIDFHTTNTCACVSVILKQALD